MISPLSASLVLGASLLLLVPSSQAETYRGKVRLNGSVQSAARPSSLSFVMTGRLTSPKSDQVATVTGGGLFRSTGDTVTDTTFTGPLKINVNVAGKITRSRELTAVTVGRRSISFPGGRVRLARPINPNLSTKQRIKGKGNYRFTF